MRSTVFNQIAKAPHDLASSQMRRTLDDGWLPMTERLQADNTAAKQHVTEARQRAGIVAHEDARPVVLTRPLARRSQE